MDWFLYDNDLRHETVKCLDTILKSRTRKLCKFVPTLFENRLKMKSKKPINQFNIYELSF